MDIYLLNEIQKLENATPSASGSGFFLSNNATTGETVWPIITSTNNRGNVDNMAWNTSSPHATFYAYFNSEFDSEHAAYMAIQNGNHQSNNMSNHEGDSMPKARFGKGNWVGVAGVYGTPYKTQSYPPLRTSLMFVKNPTSSSVNMTVNFGGSSYYNSGYDGAAFAIHLPNSLNKGNVTSTNYYKTSYQSNTQNFMISMAGFGYDTCPMEGFDSLKLKKLLKLNSKSEINMVIGCGIRLKEGVYGERFRIPFDDVYFRK